LRPDAIPERQIGHTSSVATVVQPELGACEGFRVESSRGLLGWVEETWLGSAGEAAALAIRTTDGRDGLLLSEDVEAVARESELVVMREEGRLLELDLPRLQAPATDGLVAIWRTTGEPLDPPEPPGILQRALLAIRPWRLAPPPRRAAERPLWQLLVLLYTAVVLIVGLVIGLSFLIALLVTGNAV
jgi:hypothetical protein